MRKAKDRDYYFPHEFEDKREYCCKALDLFDYNIGMHLKEKMEISTEFGSIELNYCPNCGQKVELIKQEAMIET